MTINNLITNISNALEIPSKIKYNNEIFEYNDDYQDYESVEAQDKFLFEYLFSNIRMRTFMYTTVEIIEEPKKIKKIPLPSFDEFKRMSAEERYVITAKEYDLLDELIDEINNLKKEK